MAKSKAKLPKGIRRKQNGTIEGRFVKRYPNGNTKRVSVSGKTVDEVLDKMAKARLEESAPAASLRKNVDEFLRSWLELIRPIPGEDPERPRVRYNTWQLRRNAVEKHILPIKIDGRSVGSIQLASLQSEDVDDLFDALRADGVRGQTRNAVYATLSAAFKYARKKRWMSDNILERVDKPTFVTKETAILTEDQLFALLRTAKGTPHAALILLAATTGMRQGEILALKWPAVDLENGQITVESTLTRSEIFENGSVRTVLAAMPPKTPGSHRTIAIQPELCEALRRHWTLQKAAAVEAPVGWVFTNAKGGPIDKSNLRNRIFNPLLAAAGCPKVKFHSLRHLTATLLAESNVNTKALQTMMGHADYRTTMKFYAKATPRLQELARDAMSEILRRGEENGENAA